jgi:hypothetical protein
MNTSKLGVSVCRYCQYYKAEGRRGGQCQQLGGQVQSSWKACSLAIPPFAPTWEKLEEIMGWQEDIWKLSDLPEPDYALHRTASKTASPSEVA